jgi:hypothetical protein
MPTRSSRPTPRPRTGRRPAAVPLATARSRRITCHRYKGKEGALTVARWSGEKTGSRWSRRSMTSSRGLHARGLQSRRHLSGYLSVGAQDDDQRIMSLIQLSPSPAPREIERRLTSASPPRRIGRGPVVSRSVAGQMRGTSLLVPIGRRCLPCPMDAKSVTPPRRARRTSAAERPVGAGSDFRGRGGVVRIARPPEPAEEVANLHAFFCQDLMPFLRKVVRRFASPRSTPAPRPSRRTPSAQPTTGVTMTVSAQLWRFAPSPL